MKYQHKGIFEAIQFTGTEESYKDVVAFAKVPWISFEEQVSGNVLYINFPEGTLVAYKGDYIIKHSDTKFVPMERELFEKLYEAV